MSYTIIFLGEDRLPDTMWLRNPKVGDVLKIGMLFDEELEYWDIVEVNDLSVTVRKV